MAGILALFLGSLGVDLFYCEKNKAGLVILLACLFLSWTVIAWLALAVCAIIRAIKMLTKTQEEFEQLYVNTSNEWPII